MQDLTKILVPNKSYQVAGYGTALFIQAEDELDNRYPLNFSDSSGDIFWTTKYGEFVPGSDLCAVNPIDCPWPDAVPFPEPEPEFEHDEVIEVSHDKDFTVGLVFRRHFKKKSDGHFLVYVGGTSSLTSSIDASIDYKYARKLKQ